MEWQVGYSTSSSDTEPATALALEDRNGDDRPPDVSSKTITGLSASTTYTVFVRAVVRDSDWVDVLPGGTSVWVTTSGATPSGAPSPPGGLSAEAGNQQVTASWSAPANDGGAAVTDDDVQFRASGSASWTNQRMRARPRPAR